MNDERNFEVTMSLFAMREEGSGFSADISELLFDPASHNQNTSEFNRKSPNHILPYSNIPLESFPSTNVSLYLI
jgi:hypothetical protein